MSQCSYRCGDWAIAAPSASSTGQVNNIGAALSTADTAILGLTFPRVYGRFHRPVLHHVLNRPVALSHRHPQSRFRGALFATLNPTSSLSTTSTMYPPVEPYQTGFLKVSDIHSL